MQYKLLKNSISGRKGQMIELDDKTAKAMERVGLIRANAEPIVQRGPDITKVAEPEVKKRRGRPPKKAANASDTAE